jgi:hypothetical protein
LQQFCAQSFVGFAGQFDFQTVLESQSLFLLIDPDLLFRRPSGKGECQKGRKIGV